MGFLDKIIAGLKRKEVIFRAYMIHDKGSEFEWKPALEEICDGYHAKVGSNPFDVAYELARLNIMASGFIAHYGKLPEELIARIEHLEDLMRFGGHMTKRVYSITISVNPEELEEKKVDPVSIDQLIEDAAKILESAEPVYLSFE